jgi:hypothetical protein
MGGFVVPWTVFPPVGGGDLVPRVVEGAIGRKDFHVGGVRQNVEGRGENDFTTANSPSAPHSRSKVEDAMLVFCLT